MSSGMPTRIHQHLFAARSSFTLAAMAGAISAITVPDWPMFTGPQGKFGQPSSGILLRDSYLNIPKHWTSEARDVPRGKMTTSWCGTTSNPAIPFTGGTASLAVGQNTVFASFFVPTGSVINASCATSLGSEFKDFGTWAPAHVTADGYEVPMYHPIVGGFAFFRTGEFSIVAYDLRATTNTQPKRSEVPGRDPLGSEISTTPNHQLRFAGKGVHSVALLDMGGRKLASGEVRNGSVSLDIARIGSGVYLLQTRNISGAGTDYRIVVTRLGIGSSPSSIIISNGVELAEIRKILIN